MPQIIEPIDRIARLRKRDVLYLTFFKPSNDSLVVDEFDWRNCTRRKLVIRWLDKNGIDYEPCQICWHSGLLAYPYHGQLYLNIPIDPDDFNFQKLEKLLDSESGEMKFRYVNFYCLPLNTAMKNAHHDEPGYWDNW